MLKMTSMLNRINEFIAKLSLPAPRKGGAGSGGPPVAKAPSVESALGAVGEAVKGMPVADGSALSEKLPPPPTGTLEVGSKEETGGELTSEQALEARSHCSKCRFKGCTQCMGKWFIPSTLLRKRSSKAL